MPDILNKTPLPPQKIDPEADLKYSDTSPKAVSRRRFFLLAGWWAFWATLLSSTWASLRFFFPNVLFEPPPQVRVGFPEDYEVGVVSTKWQQKYRVWVVRTKEGFYALSAICTHLGCTPVWLMAESKFKCPCHGSGFKMTGINYEGPAPRPLERVAISLADDGQIMVDRSKTFRYEKGEWERPEAFLKV
ncbi:MAG: ubiquinol-cytochrome c reductase iron-sulfur subunit [Candidatus Omnitrophica bacterium]|nr:ubiquinol-cytochrome c reductase iron-sulfur subunit [Candidatus Omnitrophota bacterium]